jgi:hypothetical protein
MAFYVQGLNTYGLVDERFARVVASKDNVDNESYYALADAKSKQLICKRSYS